MSFLELPKHIRHKIYVELLRSDDPIQIVAHSTPPSIHLAILRTQRKIYNEASEALYSENIFHFAINNRQGVDLPPETFFQKNISVDKIRLMKRISVDVAIGQYNDATSVIRVIVGRGTQLTHRLIQPSAFFAIPRLSRFVRHQHSLGIVRQIGVLRMPGDSPASFLDRLWTGHERSLLKGSLGLVEDSKRTVFQPHFSIPHDLFVNALEWDVIYLCKFLKSLQNLEELQVHVIRPSDTDIMAGQLKRTLDAFRQFRGLQRASMTGVHQPDIVKGFVETVVRPVPTFRLKDLPGNVRYQIYREALVTPHDISVQEDSLVENQIQGLGVGLLGTCRQIFFEARPILYSENSFVAHVNVWVDRNIWKRRADTGRSITTNNARFITRLKIIIDSRHKSHFPALVREWLDPSQTVPPTGPQWELWVPYSEDSCWLRTQIPLYESGRLLSIRTIRACVVMSCVQLKRIPFSSEQVSDGLEGTLDDFVEQLDFKLGRVANIIPSLHRLEDLVIIFPTSSARWRDWGYHPSIQVLFQRPMVLNIALIGYVPPVLAWMVRLYMKKRWMIAGHPQPRQLTVNDANNPMRGVFVFNAVAHHG
ncbi:MAG: cytosolic leucyl tRNA synthetase [Chaenotheca gracillima]|nr:MAG: cytosolic leucyl tRNA synthetase [Chaenotheca gracillima]